MNALALRFCHRMEDIDTEVLHDDDDCQLLLELCEQELGQAGFAQISSS